MGDVAGHDRQAAATMAQIRNLLRGVAYGTRESPAATRAGRPRRNRRPAPGAAGDPARHGQRRRRAS
ncbi:hypothetical protein ACQSSU_23370 [Micromonospora echinospora]